MDNTLDDCFIKNVAHVTRAVRNVHNNGLAMQCNSYTTMFTLCCDLERHHGAGLTVLGEENTALEWFKLALGSFDDTKRNIVGNKHLHQWIHFCRQAQLSACVSLQGTSFFDPKGKALTFRDPVAIARPPKTWPHIDPAGAPAPLRTAPMQISHQNHTQFERRAQRTECYLALIQAHIVYASSLYNVCSMKLVHKTVHKT